MNCRLPIKLPLSISHSSLGIWAGRARVSFILISLMEPIHQNYRNTNCTGKQSQPKALRALPFYIKESLPV